MYTHETLEPGRFVRSIAAMIASSLPEYAAQLDQEDIRRALDEQRCNADPGSSLERGVLTPLQKLRAFENGPRYILIDALDEALLVRDNPQTIIDVLATRLDRLPPW